MRPRWLGALLICLLAGFSQAQNTAVYSEMRNELRAAASARSSSAGAALERINKADSRWKVLSETLADYESKDNVKLALQSARASLSGDATGTLVQLHRAEGWMRLGLYRQVIGDLLRGSAQLAEGGREEVRFLAKEFHLSEAQTKRLLQEAQSGELRAMTARLDVAAAERLGNLLSAWEKGTPKTNEARVRLAEALGWHLVLQEARDVQKSTTSYEPLLQKLAAGQSVSAAEIAPLRSEAARIAKRRREALNNLEQNSSAPIAASNPPTPAKEASRELGEHQASLLAQSYSILGEGLAMHNAGRRATNLAQAAAAVAELGANTDLPEAQKIASRLEHRIKKLNRQRSSRDFQTALVELNELKQALQNKNDHAKAWWMMFVLPLWARLLAWLGLSGLLVMVVMRASSLGENPLAKLFSARTVRVPVAEASWHNMRKASFIFASIAPLQTLALLGELVPALHILRSLEVSAGGAGGLLLWIISAMGLVVLNLAVSQQQTVLEQNRQAVNNWNRGDRQPGIVSSQTQPHISQAPTRIMPEPRETQDGTKERNS